MPTATQLIAPANVVVTNPAGTSTLTITFTDPNPAPNVATYTLQFLSQADPTVTVPVLLTPANIVKPSGGTQTATISGVAPSAASNVTTALLQSSYVASVVIKANTGFSDSNPGLSTFWTGTLGVVLEIGSHTLTLTTQPGSNSGIYRLPVSSTNPLIITFADVQNFLTSVTTAIGVTLPTTFPDTAHSQIANFSLSIEKLAVDTNRHLFTLAVSANLNFTLLPGLTVDKVALAVLCTNGVDQL